MFSSFDLVERDGLFIKTSTLDEQIMMLFFDSHSKGFALKIFTSEAQAASFMNNVITQNTLK